MDDKNIIKLDEKEMPEDKFHKIETQETLEHSSGFANTVFLSFVILVGVLLALVIFIGK